jgi:hypothetical protein
MMTRPWLLYLIHAKNKNAIELDKLEVPLFHLRSFPN